MFRKDIRYKVVWLLKYMLGSGNISSKFYYKHTMILTDCRRIIYSFYLSMHNGIESYYFNILINFSSIHLNLHTSIQQIFIEHLLITRYRFFLYILKNQHWVKLDPILYILKDNLRKQCIKKKENSAMSFCSN